MVGTMIEIPRAALTADKVAEAAEFFSFGTNDLTQMSFGFSRDDVAGFLPDYIEQGVLDNDPFQTVDQDGVGQLIEVGIERGRKTRPDLKVGFVVSTVVMLIQLSFVITLTWIMYLVLRFAYRSPD